MLRFIFDLDGTITAEETLPIIAKHFKINGNIERLTNETILGHIPFKESFQKRVDLLAHLPVSEVRNVLSNVRLFPLILDFILANKNMCILATGNIDLWVEGITTKIGITSYTSKALCDGNTLKDVTDILDKIDVVQKYKDLGDKVVFIGDGHNDTEAMQRADIAIASALIHTPAKSVINAADHIVATEEDLVLLLNYLKTSLATNY